MKSEKGITLSSLVIYIVLIILVIGLLSLVSQQFIKNTKYIADSGKYIQEYNKFNMYFIEDIKNNTDIYSIQNNTIVFDDGTTYTFSNNDIYRNKVKICDNIEYCEFYQNDYIDEKDFKKKIITVKIQINGSEGFETQNNYVLKYW